MTINPTHDRLQQECFTWHWNSYPHQRGLLHANNNNAHNAIAGARLKAIGVVAGVADMEYLLHGRMHFVELKVGADFQSDKQKAFQSLAEAHGASYHIVSSLEAFQSLVGAWNAEK